MNREQAESGIIALLCFLAVAARELMNEPKIYGPMRLMEASLQLTELAADCGVENELVAEVSQRITTFPLDSLPEAEEEFMGCLDDLVLLLATWVRRQ
jgi:hypothetical protein